MQQAVFIFAIVQLRNFLALYDFSFKLIACLPPPLEWNFIWQEQMQRNFSWYCSREEKMGIQWKVLLPPTHPESRLGNNATSSPPLYSHACTHAQFPSMVQGPSEAHTLLQNVWQWVTTISSRTQPRGLGKQSGKEATLAWTVEHWWHQIALYSFHLGYVHLMQTVAYVNPFSCLDFSSQFHFKNLCSLSFLTSSYLPCISLSLELIAC